MATFLYRILDASGVEMSTADRGFTDVRGNAHEDAINGIASIRVAKGTSPTTFSPDAPITRAQFATLLAGAIVRTGAFVRPVAGRVALSVSTWQQPQPPPPCPSRERLLRTVVGHIESLDAGRARVAIDGPTAAGKTSLGHELALMLAEAARDVFRASLDDFKRP